MKPRNWLMAALVAARTVRQPHHDDDGRERIVERTEPDPGAEALVVLLLVLTALAAALFIVAYALDWSTQALGGALGGTIPNHYGLVREAIDRGVPLEEVKPRNAIAAELRKLIEPSPAAKGAGRRGAAPRAESRGLSWAR